MLAKPLKNINNQSTNDTVEQSVDFKADKDLQITNKFQEIDKIHS